MQFREFFMSLSAEQKKQLAIACGTSLGYLRKRATDRGLLGPAFAIAVERFSQGRCTRRDLRPLDYQQIWPELKISEGVEARGGVRA